MDAAAVAEIYHDGGLYEAVYRGRGKDYVADAERIVEQVHQVRPGASSLLDVACGTGTHLRHFATVFDQVAGVDLADDMLRVAREHLPEVPLHVADMRDFDLGRRFDVVTCLFSSIGYVRDHHELTAAVGCMARHLTPSGVLLLEPWCFPASFEPGQVMSDLVTVDGTTIARVSHAVLTGDATRIEAHYTVAHPDRGVWHLVDVHVLTLFDREQYEAAITAAGCSVRYLPATHGVGLFVGIAEG